MTAAFFITAIGTSIGKTYIAASLLAAASTEGRSVHALKPLMSGYDPEQMADSDAGRLLAACGRSVTQAELDAVCLHAFPDELAPNVAARQADVALDDGAITEFCGTGIAGGADLVLIEGAGGVLSPMTDAMLQADLIARLSLPAVIVAANYLGAVSHTLSAAEALDRRGIAIAAIVVSNPKGLGAPDALIMELRRWRPDEIYLSAPHNDASVGARLLKAIAP